MPTALPQQQVFNGGQMTDLPEYDQDFDPTALMEIVSPGNVEEGVNYAITLALLSAFMMRQLLEPTIITDGADVGTPYDVDATDTRVLVNKTIGAATFIDLDDPTLRNYLPVLIMDIKGDADVNNITVTFTGTVNGLASPIVIDAPFGGWTFNPLDSGNWYLTSA
jgi:hypothetical protein